MGSSTQTGTLLLPQFSDNDKPTWRGDINDAMSKIDAAHAALTLRVSNDETDLSTHYDKGVTTILYVSATGDDTKNGLTWSTAKATVAAALAALAHAPGRIICGIGTIPLGSGVSWAANDKAGIVGVSKMLTTLQTTAQSQAALDFSAVGYGMNGCEIGKFTINGDGLDNPTNTNKGLKLSPTVSMVGANIHDIAVTNTGGSCFDFGMAELNTLENLTANEPKNAATNDIPYVMATGAFNGNAIGKLMLNGISAGANVGPSGAFVIKDSGSAPTSNKIHNPRTEALHLSNGGTIFSIKGNSNVLSDMEFFDTNKTVAGNTGTSFVRFLAPATNLGGNIVRGVIPGKDTTATSVDMGVDMQQGRNFVTGVKGYKGTNVTIAVGVGDTDVDLHSAVSTATDPAVIDNSGLSTNKIRDSYMNIYGGNGTGPRTILSGGYYGPANHVPGTGPFSNNYMYAIPVMLPQAMTATSIECEVTTAGSADSLIRLGIYAAGAGDKPSTLILDAGTVPGNAVGVQGKAITQVIPAGFVWLVALFTGTTIPQMRTVGAGSLAPVIPAAFSGGMNCYYIANGTGVLPGAFGGTTPFTGGPKIMVKAA
jgi:hypothetical protein